MTQVQPGVRPRAQGVHNAQQSCWGRGIDLPAPVLDKELPPLSPDLGAQLKGLGFTPRKEGASIPRCLPATHTCIT